MRTQQLTEDRLTQLRAMLVEQRTFRIDQLAQLYDPVAGPLSSAVPEVFAELAAGARAALRDIHAALLRLDHGTFGVCTVCGGEVGNARLEILPQAALCMPCQRGRTAVSRPQ